LIRNIHRVLRPGGVCYFAGPNLLWPIEPHVFWPFVHWLPRKRATALMRLLGSQNWQYLDAHSVPSWRLEQWFRHSGLNATIAVNSWAAAQASGGARILSRIAARIPNSTLKMLNPVLPGFVYLLQKTDRRSLND
jgi:hypothetical protein